MFFFQGDADAPFAVISAEGGFSYVASFMPRSLYALDLNERGYNAFVLQYRTGGLDVAVEDLARAISFIFEHAEEIGVSTENYSFGGGSAGGQMVARLSSYGTAEFGGDDLPAAAAGLLCSTRLIRITQATNLLHLPVSEKMTVSRLQMQCRPESRI